MQNGYVGKIEIRVRDRYREANRDKIRTEIHLHVAIGTTTRKEVDVAIDRRGKTHSDLDKKYI